MGTAKGRRLCAKCDIDCINDEFVFGGADMCMVGDGTEAAALDNFPIAEHEKDRAYGVLIDNGNRWSFDVF